VRTLRNLSRGVEVSFLQRLLNKAAGRSGGRLRPIAEDGKFGSHTETAVRHFQTRSTSPRLKEDGVVGTHTWRALGLQVDIDHSIRLIPQNSNWSCWNAAATMVSEAHGGAQSIMTSPEHMQYYLSSGMDGVAADQALARELHWRVLSYSPSLQELISIMQRTPIYVSGILTTTRSSHAVTFGGLYSDGEADGTLIKVYNPSPVGTGLIHPLWYTQMASPISGSPFVPFGFLVPPGQAASYAR